MAKGSTVLRDAITSYAYVVLWMSISISVIMFNKWLLAFSGFPFPIALTLWHMVFCSTVGFLCVRVFKFVKSHNMSASDYMRRVMPIGILYAASLWLSNSAYLYLSVSFIQQTKSLMPGLVYASGIYLGTEKFSVSSTSNMLLIAFGVFVCAIGEANLVVKGLCQQLLALGFEATRLTLVQILMKSKGLNMNPIQSLYYVSPACLVSLLVPFVLVEVPNMQSTPDWKFYPSVFLANAMAAFVLNLAVFLLIGKTSALTMNIAGVIKDWLLIFFSYYIFQAPITNINLLGYVFCCSGVFVHQYRKLQEMKARDALKTKSVDDDIKGGLKEGEETSDATKASSTVEQGGERENILDQMKRLQEKLDRLDSKTSSSVADEELPRTDSIMKQAN